MKIFSYRLARGISSNKWQEYGNNISNNNTFNDDITTINQT